QVPYVKNQILVQLEPGIPGQEVAAHLSGELGVLPDIRCGKQVSEYMRVWILEFNEDVISIDEMLRQTSVTPGVVVAQRNHIGTERYVPNDPFFGNQWHHVQSGDHDIDSDLAWDITTGGTTIFGDDIVACVIETGGADWDHTDLIDNHWVNENEIPDNGVDDDDNGYVDDYDGWSLVNNSDQIAGGNHGTAVSSMIGATGDNSTGIAGVNHQVKLMQVHMGSINEANVIEAYTYPLVMRKRYNETGGAEGAFVVVTNASWGVDNGQPEDSPLWCAMYDSLGTYGVISCGATANNNVNIDVVGDLPTACPSEYMVAVTATNDNDERTFSGYGVTQIDLGAPGEDVYLASNTNNYSYTSGTSFASPCTAGAVALLYSADCVSLMALVQADPAAAAQLVIEYIFYGVDQVSNLSDEVATGGRLNVYNSLQMMLMDCSSSSCIPPFNITATQIPGSLDYTIAWGITESMESFSLQYRPQGTTEWTVVNDISDNSFTLENLMACTTYEVQLAAACGETDSDWSSTFTFTTEGCCENPALASIEISSVNETTIFVQWDEVFGATEYIVTIYDADSNLIDEESVLSNEIEIGALQPCASYFLSVEVICTGAGGGEPELLAFSTSGCGDCSDLEYCSITGDASLEWIEQVTFGMIDNLSSSNGGYGDYTNLSTPVVPGLSYTIGLTPGFSGFGFSEYFLVWMDIDNDGEFETGELVYDPGTTTTELIEGTIVIPVGIPEGSMRMRIGMSYVGSFGGGAQPEPCGSNEYGETEDYCIDVLSSGVNENETSSVAIWPIPAADVLNLMATERIANLEVYDVAGRSVLKLSNLPALVQMDISSLRSGTYEARMQLASGAMVTRSLLVK
ncbi:MAG: S8 family serine peptidase, partial [Flavobacteriales bacterium]|nr:S8 family serine peptidase [Flavobacteriales bacterium]